ncbi:MAG: hypothetical protein NZT92_23060 [Abditibacteriales bacterium]|nr:hypothetical protein [Abditibacteriales bacterium]
MFEIVRLGFYLTGWWALVYSWFFAERLVAATWQWSNKREPQCPPDLLLRLGRVWQFMGAIYTACLILRVIFHYPRTTSEPSIIQENFIMAVCLTLIVAVVMDNERMERLFLWLRRKLARSNLVLDDRLAIAVKLAVISVIAIAQFMYWIVADV